MRPGSIVLLHDGGADRSCVVAGLTPLIQDLRARGYRFVTVEGLLSSGTPVPQGELQLQARARRFQDRRSHSRAHCA